jgi:hypothetical protein
MQAADVAPPPGAQQAVSTSEHVWRTHGEEPVVLSGTDLDDLGLADEVVAAAVALPRLRRIECHLVEDRPVESIVEAVSRLTDTAWDVWILLPSRCLGSAHEALRGMSVRLQGWWLDNENNIKFGVDETP